MRSTTNASLLLLLTSAIAACGGESTIASPPADDAGQEASALSDADTPRFSDASAPPPDTQGDACAPGSRPEGDGGCVPDLTIRRPFLVGSSLRSAKPVARADWRAEVAALAASLPEATARKLATTWLKDGLEEHASIAAFARFTMHLLSLGAPPQLVLAAQRASIDEIHHAKMCFGLAERYGATLQGPGVLSLENAIAPASLADVAALAAEEGCVGETLGAALAREQLAIAKDPEAIRVLQKIARDEARHAELSWKFVRWAILQGGDAVRRVVEERVESAIAGTLAMEIQSYDGIDLDVWHAHGRLTCRESRAIAEIAIREVVRPCLHTASIALGGVHDERRALRTS